jgi:hypothetical protein
MAAPIYPPGISPQQFDLATKASAQANSRDWMLARGDR